MRVALVFMSDNATALKPVRFCEVQFLIVEILGRSTTEEKGCVFSVRRLCLFVEREDYSHGTLLFVLANRAGFNSRIVLGPRFKREKKQKRKKRREIN